MASEMKKKTTPNNRVTRYMKLSLSLRTLG